MSGALDGLRIGELSGADGTSLGRHDLVCCAQNHENAMRKQNLAAMRFEELWQLYEQLAEVLADKITAEKRELEERLAKLKPIDLVREARNGPSSSLSLTGRASRRKYPKVLPKYSNPLVPSQKWSGRGKTPRWVTEALAAGQQLDDLKIEYTQMHNRDERPRAGRTTPAVR